MPTRTTTLLVAVLLIIAATPMRAFAYVEEGVSPTMFTTCVACHGATGYPAVESNADTQTVTGPHLGYVSTSQKCDGCHTMHNAAGQAPKLLPEFTIVATCEICHDGTGGAGVYGALEARGVPVEEISSHRMEMTNAIPGGDPSTGGTATVDFDPAEPGRPLICSDCHSVHGADTVDPFTGDRRRVSASSTTLGFPITSSRLLRRKPGRMGSGVDQYGSGWCAACHKGRLVAHPSHNHTVGSEAEGFFYAYLIRMATDVSSSATETGGLGGYNRGYLMTKATKDLLSGLGSGPICQQCHEDARDTGTVASDGSTADAADFVVSSVDGASSSDNPRFQTFPHEAWSADLLVEPVAGKALCDDCHKPNLPSWPW